MCRSELYLSRSFILLVSIQRHIRNRIPILLIYLFSSALTNRSYKNLAHRVVIRDFVFSAKLNSVCVLPTAPDGGRLDVVPLEALAALLLHCEEDGAVAERRRRRQPDGDEARERDLPPDTGGAVRSKYLRRRERFKCSSC